MKVFIPEDLGLKPIPPGIYKVTATGFEVRTSQQGNIYLRVTFTVLSQGPDPDINTVGRKFSDNFTFTEESIWKLAQLFEAATKTKIPSKEWELDELLAFIQEHVSGKEFLANLATETYEGQVRTRPKDYRALVS